jgi:hypothetical protein
LNWDWINFLDLINFFLSQPFTEEDMKVRPDETTIATIQSAAKKLTGAARRAFQAGVTLDHCHGSPRFARELFGWSPDSIRKGLAEREMHCIIVDHPRSGRPKYVDKIADLQNDIRSLVDPNSCTHPTFDNTFRYTRMTAKSVIETLVQEKGYKLEELPAESTMRELLGKMGYRLRRVQKTKPQKKFPKPTRSLQTSKPLMPKATMTIKHCESR